MREFGNVLEAYDVMEGKPFAGYKSFVLRERRENVLQDALLHAVRQTVDVVREGVLPVCGGADGFAALAIAEAARDSVRLGQSVAPVSV